MLIDTHCHLNAPPLLSRHPEVLDAARRAGVTQFLVPGVTPRGWGEIAALARAQGPAVQAAFGIHPMAADAADAEALALLRQYAREACAIGEIGLDYTLTGVPREAQQAAFRAQLRVAADAGLPVILHCRKAFRDLLTILDEEGGARAGGVMHAFSGSPEIAAACLQRGLFISLSGTVTYATAVRPVAVARQLPLDRLLLETDSPDLTPEPHRGRPNEPAFLAETARKVAEIRGASPDTVERATTDNARRLFRLSPPPWHP
ncbi:TatD family hydrolase [Geobacter pickeringii]|uniref:Hydrolase TatD n=1 Tax=Geobacter pickeringii TaxID=345632 RepID=A0A0B5BCM6_9BACT|nr:TatD family hydrolase [Geobacter pickeringii]AJE04468.1 hydrolase TatD [Geobacter pickeringii]